MPTLNTEDSSASDQQNNEINIEAVLPSPVGDGSGSQTDDKNPDSGSSAESKQDAKGDAPTSLMEAVQKAVATDSEAAKLTVDSSTTENQDPNDTDPSNETEADKAEEDWDGKSRLDKNPRFQKVVAERDELKDKASRFDTVVTYMQTNGLTSEEFEQGANIMALMKRDPLAALEQLRPIYESLQHFAGEKLPDDLEQKVEQGFIDEESAREVAQSRNKARFIEQRTSEQQQRAQEIERQQQAQSFSESLSSAVDAWEQNAKSKDPDYQTKSTFVQDRFRTLVTSNPPRNPNEAILLAEQAYTEVSSKMKALVPNKQAVRTVVSNRSSAVSATQQPRTLLEAAWGAVKR